jgi:hypothetical protein
MRFRHTIYPWYHGRVQRRLDNVRSRLDALCARLRSRKCHLTQKSKADTAKGPMILTPLQELPAYGRNPVYMIGMLLFVREFFIAFLMSCY